LESKEKCFGRKDFVSEEEEACATHNASYIGVRRKERLDLLKHFGYGISRKAEQDYICLRNDFGRVGRN
jgi:hypothetical protein